MISNSLLIPTAVEELNINLLWAVIEQNRTEQNRTAQHSTAKKNRKEQKRAEKNRKEPKRKEKKINITSPTLVHALV